MIYCNVERLRRNGNICLFNTKADLEVIAKAHNQVVDALEKAYREINRLSKEIEQFKAGEQNG